MNDYNYETHQRYRNKVIKFNEKDLVLSAIVEKAASIASEKALDAAYGGAMNDGGAGEDLRVLNAFLDGINYANVKETSTYSDILKQIRRESDPEHKKYLELKAKFE